ncbi:MAG: glycosyltransferase [Elusimicrobia bacterium]|nr:glycosyltransferase [Elusimicrobiota bacterium]
MKLTVFHLDGEKTLRGGERQVLYLAEYLRRQGHENIIVCREGYPLHKEAVSKNFKTLCLPFWMEWDPFSAWKLRRVIQKNPHAIAHAHTGHAAALAFLATRGTNALRVVHRRVDFSVSNFLSLRYKYLSADRVITVSKAIQKILLQQIPTTCRASVVHDGFPYEKIKMVYSGIDSLAAPTKRRNLFRQNLAKEFHLHPDWVWIGNLAALVPHKNQKTLIEALPSVLQKIPQTHLLLAGEGPDLKELIQLRKKLGLENHIHFLGFQKNPFDILKCLDVFVIPSWGEGMGSVLLEAMAAQIPIVGTTAGGIPEVVLHNHTGLLVPPREPLSLSRAILEMIQNKPLAEQCVKNGLERLQEFSVEKMGSKIEAIYQSLYESSESGESLETPRLSLILITKNEEQDIKACLQSVQGTADEIIVVDDFSSDRTRDIAQEYGARIIQHDFESYASQKQFALEQASGEWVLNLDADERLSPELNLEIREILNSPSKSVHGYWVPYEIHFLNQKLRYAGLGNEKHLRLFQRKFAHYTGGLLHEGISVPAPLNSLKNKIIHKPYRDLTEYFEKFERYTSLAAQKAFEQGRRFRWYHYGVYPAEFLKKYILQLGFLDAAPGFIWCRLSALHHSTKYKKLKEIGARDLGLGVSSNNN